MRGLFLGVVFIQLYINPVIKVYWVTCKVLVCISITIYLRRWCSLFYVEYVQCLHYLQDKGQDIITLMTLLLSQLNKRPFTHANTVHALRACTPSTLSKVKQNPEAKINQQRQQTVVVFTCTLKTRILT